MEAFLTSLLLTAIVQTGDRAQLLCAALGQRFARPVPLTIGVALACGLMALIGALGGVVVGTWISLDALRLFYALSLLFAGLGMLAPRRPVDTLPGWRTGPLLTGRLLFFLSSRCFVARTFALKTSISTRSERASRAASPSRA